ncbi:MAG TPA: hypothetical protein VEJ23_02945 [Solirubrobacteraceae bacterium]|nr:hypothetical protein [Solirubrobacteraceae bacterium]
MIYCVVPRPLADELYSRLSKHYEGESGVTVIVDRREHDRRARGARGRSGSDDGPQRRVVRDRRRARVTGDPLPLARIS